jgi:hypothetical protein
LTDLQVEVDKALAEFRGLDQAPPVVKLEGGFKRLRDFQVRTAALVEQVQKEMDRWARALAAEVEKSPDDKERLTRARAAREARARDLEDLRQDLAKLGISIASKGAAVSERTRQESGEALKDQVQRESAALATLFVIQAQVRVYLIELRPMNYELNPAVAFAKENRLDLMNQRGMVVDSWRQITVTAKALQAGLNLVFNANLATQLGRANPVDYRASASTYSAGIHFDSPLNRYAERNFYRASQIAYQQARRAFITLEDSIERSIRQDLRSLNTERLNFEIQRQSLISATRQLESAREELLLQGAMADPTSTQNVLNALQAVLAAKNQLIGSWVAYETDRIQLLLDLEELQLDERGMYSNEHDNQPDQPGTDPARDGRNQPVPQALP